MRDRLQQKVDELLERPYWVIDMLPAQVPAQGGGQFFDVEQYYLAPERKGRLRERFADVLLKLNCYYDMRVHRYGVDATVRNPPAEELARWIVQGDSLAILLDSQEVLITSDGDDTHITVYNPSKELLHLLHALALASGLFLWQP